MNMLHVNTNTPLFDEQAIAMLFRFFYKIDLLKFNDVELVIDLLQECLNITKEL